MKILVDVKKVDGSRLRVPVEVDFHGELARAMEGVSACFRAHSCNQTSEPFGQMQRDYNLSDQDELDLYLLLPWDE